MDDSQTQSPIDPSSILFPKASTSISTTLTSLKRTNLSLPNRLHSIASDAAFVQRTANFLNLPLIANERCGSWYIPVGGKAGSAYFKSTDGHFGQWSLSLRRLNLQVLDVIEGGSGGCIIIDSTRKGKSMPDALSKTVPIWICVLNLLLFPDDEEAAVMRTPESVVSASECAQIEERIPSFVHAAQSLNLDLDALRLKLRGKPMIPIWATPDSDVPPDMPASDKYNLVVLCTASSRSSSSGRLGTAYVQGAADDAESWAMGLDAATFWSHNERLLSMSEDDLPDAIAKLVAESREKSVGGAPVSIRPTRSVWIGTNAAIERCSHDFDVIVSCSEKPDQKLVETLKSRYIHLRCTFGKVGSRQLRTQLPKLQRVESDLDPASKILFACPTGKDLAVGVALALMCLCCKDEGILVPHGSGSALNKTLVKHRLSWIMVSMPDAAPSRATLQSVNAFLLG